MANDREFIVQSLIAQGKLVKTADIDPTQTYAQIGIFQQNENRSGSSNNAYPSYAIPISEFGSKKKNFIGVDPEYGNDEEAVANGLYNLNFPFKSFENALNAIQSDPITDPPVVILLYPGLHITTQITNLQCTIFGLAGSVLHNPNGGLFYFETGSTLDIQGDAILSGTGDVPVIYVSGSGKNTIKCKKIINTSGSFYAGVYFTGGTTTITCDEIDTRANLGNPVTLDGGELILNVNIIRYSWVGYILSTGSKLIANVNKTIQHNCVGDPTSLGNSGILIGNGANNASVILNGDFYDEKTIDPLSGSGALLNFQAGASNSFIIHNGSRSYVKQQIALRIVNCPNSEMIVNSEIINTWVNTLGGASGMGAYLNSGTLRLKNKLQTIGGAATDPCIKYDGGTLILDDAVILANTGAQSIAAPSPITYRCYSGYANTAPAANATNAIAGTTLIVNSLIQ